MLNVRVGEGRHTALLYILFFLLILGSVWGETTAEALFLDKIGTDNYSFRFIAEAVFTLAFTLIYTAFVDRVSNTHLLVAICAITSISLLVTRLLLILDPNMPAAFYLFYLIGRTTRVIFSVHTWTYASEFYDTRAAKRIFPLIGSSGRIAGLLGGVALRFIIPTVHAENIPYIWIVLLAVSAWLVWSIPRWTGSEISAPKARDSTGNVWESFSGGWHAIRESRLLQLLAIGTTTMTMLLALLNFQADYVFFQTYQGADELAGLFGLLKSLANAIALPFQLLLLTRIVNQVGVGWTNLFYPILAVGSYGLLGIFPLFPSAVTALFVQQGLRSGVRNPLDNMLYNAVPRVVKGRARAFVNAVLVPIAMFLAGVMLLPIRGSALPWLLFALGCVVGLIYLAVTWRTRSAYSQALVETLEAEDTALYQLAGAEWDATDRAALDHVLTRLRESASNRSDGEGKIIFFAQLAYEIGGQAALPALGEIAAAPSPLVRAAILEIVGATGLANPQVRQLCSDGLTDPDPIVRRTALAMLEEQNGPRDLSLLELALDHVHDPDPGVRTRAISLLLRSGDFYYLTTASSALNEMLTGGDLALRARAISVLGEIGDPRFVRTLAPYLSDPNESVRRAAAQACASVASASAPIWVCDLTLDAARQALSDPAKAVRLAAVQILARLDPAQTRPILLKALQDESVRVRESARQVLESMGAEAVDALEALLTTKDGRARETAVIALLHLSSDKYHTRADTEIRETLRRAYQNLVLARALASLDFSGAALTVHILNDRIQALLAHVFLVLTALHGAEAIQVIRHNLRSSDTHAHANAVEALEAITSPTVARLVAPLSSDAKTSEIIALAQEEFDLQPTDPTAALEMLLMGQDPWLVAVGLYLVGEAGQPGLALLDAPRLFSRTRRNEIITAALDSPDPLVTEVARRVACQFRLPSADEEVSTMSKATLSTIEKVIFLKEVSIFSEMTVAQIRALAGIAKEASFDDDDLIFREGEPGDTLYVVVSGRVGLERTPPGKTRSVARLATLEASHYFGEMSIFDQAPRSATAIAIGSTLLLSIHREPLIALIEGDPTLAMDLIRVLSQRLREANEQIASKTRAAPRELQKLYDQLI